MAPWHDDLDRLSAMADEIVRLRGKLIKTRASLRAVRPGLEAAWWPIVDAALAESSLTPNPDSIKGVSGVSPGSGVTENHRQGDAESSTPPAPTTASPRPESVAQDEIMAFLGESKWHSADIQNHLAPDYSENPVLPTRMVSTGWKTVTIVVKPSG